MSKAMVVKPPKEENRELQTVLRQRGSRARACKPAGGVLVGDESRRTVGKPGVVVPRPVKNVSGDSSCSSGSSSGRSSAKEVKFRVSREQNGPKPVKVMSRAKEAPGQPLLLLAPTSAKRRCAWITLNSDPLYISFHDEEWGVPVRDDKKLFELLVFSQALAELSWSVILKEKVTFREILDNFNPASVAKFSENNVVSLKLRDSPLLSELKLRAVVDNARQMMKVVEEFGSFSNYFWSFVNNKPVVNCFRYPRQVPVRTPKAEAISKDLIRRGFQCVGPTVVYSFMQAAGLVNDHLCSCFRYKECNLLNKKTNGEETQKLAKELDSGCSFQA